MKNFRPIPWSERRYWINRLGTVIWDSVKNHFLHPSYIDNSGYLAINLADPRYRCGNRTYRIHELVWAAWGEDKPKRMVIDHIDGDPFNNRIDNLQLITQSENTRKAKRRGHCSVKVTVFDGKEFIFDTKTAAERFLSGLTCKSRRACRLIYGYTKYIDGHKVEFEDNYLPSPKQLSLF